MTHQAGKVYLIGAGPGDPGLITVKGLECLRRADVVVYDYLANPVFLAEAPAAAERIYVGKRKGLHHYPQDEINRLLVEKGRAGLTVARLKGGDPFIFGRGGEEALCLAEAGIPFEVVPGITAGLAAACYTGIPLTHRDFTTTLGLVTGHEDPDKNLSTLDWEKLATAMGTLVFYMGMANLANITEQLLTHGRAPQTPVAVVRWATTPRQQTLVGTLADIVAKVKAADFKPPAVILIGEVVALREQLAWFDNRPLSGRRILVTRAADQAAALTGPLAALGAEPVLCPTIAIVPPPDPADLDAALAGLPAFDLLILTSVNAVAALFDRLAAAGRDARALAGVTVVAVGPKTAAAIAAQGIRADLVPADYRAEGVVALLKERVAGKRVLYPRAELARDLIVTELGAAGAEVVAPIAYASAVPAGAAENLAEALTEGLDLLTFSASSTVRNFAALLDTDQLAAAQQVPVAAIGPLTSQTARELGFTVAVEPAASTLDAMVEAIANYFKQATRDAERGTR